MHSVTQILQADPDGVIHLQVPDDLRSKKLQVTAHVVGEAEDSEHGGAKLILNERGRHVLVAPQGAPAMTSELIKQLAYGA